MPKKRIEEWINGVCYVDASNDNLPPWLNKESDDPKSPEEENSIDSVGLFVGGCCILDRKAESGRTEVFKRYKAFCREANLHPVSQREFNRRIDGMKIKRSQKGKIRIWKGLKLR